MGKTAKKTEGAETPVVTKESYDKLLSAYTSLKERVGLDHHLVKILDAQAGLI